MGKARYVRQRKKKKDVGGEGSHCRLESRCRSARVRCGFLTPWRPYSSNPCWPGWREAILLVVICAAALGQRRSGGLDVVQQHPEASRQRGLGHN